MRSAAAHIELLRVANCDSISDLAARLRCQSKIPAKFCCGAATRRRATKQGHAGTVAPMCDMESHQ
jgi:hypothetical protein